MNIIEIFKNKYLKSKFSQDFTWIFTSQLVLATNGILLNIFISNFYSAELLGVFNQALSFFLILTAVSNFGLFNTTVKFVSESANSTEIIKKIASTNFILAFVFSTLVVLFIWLISYMGFSLFSSFQVLKASKIVLLAIPCFTMNRIFMGYFNGIRNMKMYSLMRIFRWVSYILFFVIISVISHDFYSSLYSFLLVEFLLLFIISTKYYSFFSLKINFAEIKKNLSFGSKSFLSEIVSYSQDKLDIIIIGYILSASDVGIYSFAASIAKGVLIIPAVFMQNVNPIISKLWVEQKINGIQIYITKLKNYSIKIMIPFSLLVIILYFIIINFFMPPEFSTTMVIFLIMLLGAFLLSSISWSGGFLLMAGKLNPNFIRVVLLLLISGVLNSTFAYSFGLIGAASAYLVFSITVLFLQNWFLGRFMNIRLMGDSL